MSLELTAENDFETWFKRFHIDTIRLGHNCTIEDLRKDEEHFREYWEQHEKGGFTLIPKK